MGLFSFSHQPNGQMTLSDHIKELRNRLLVTIACFIVGFLGLLPFSAQITNLFLELGRQASYHFIYISPQELFLVQLNLVLWGSLSITLPMFIYQVYRFLAPALSDKGKKALLVSVILGFLFFIIGIVFAVKVFLPFMLGFLIQFTQWVDVEAAIRISDYCHFILSMLLLFGLIFELPVISFFLSWLNLITPEILIKARKVMIVIIFVLAAILTPPDVLSQIMVAIPMVVLYEVSILITKMCVKMKNQQSQRKETL